MKTKYYLLLSCLCFLFVTSVNAQNLVLPQASQCSEVKQTLGSTLIDIVYHSPYVNKRQVWGELVPYGKVWRAGANENTTISFTDDVTIEGKPIPAGIYGLHIIPNENEWTMIFSKDHTSWGSYFYNQNEDALRVTVKPASREYQDWLDYTFTDRKAESAKVSMSWEKMKVSFTVAADVKAITLKRIREQLRNTPAFGWHGWEEGAHYCIENKFNYDEALTWINRSIVMEENYTNVAAKAQLLTLMGNTASAAETKKKVLALIGQAGEASMNAFGYELMNENDLPMALEVFKLNTKKHPDSWNAFDSMAEAYASAGDKKQALTNYKTALKTAPDDQKERIKKAIATLEKG